MTVTEHCESLLTPIPMKAFLRLSSLDSFKKNRIFIFVSIFLKMFGICSCYSRNIPCSCRLIQSYPFSVKQMFVSLVLLTSWQGLVKLLSNHWHKFRTGGERKRLSYCEKSIDIWRTLQVYLRTIGPFILFLSLSKNTSTAKGLL